MQSQFLKKLKKTNDMYFCCCNTIMHPPRFSHPNYMPHQNQWRPHGPRFGPMRPMQYKNDNRGSYPNNEDHWCETCDRGFRTAELILNHKQQHQKCNIDGCQFIAHPKVITKHIQMQHSTGLYKKIAKLQNPEEIQKWREERKKRYPTKENIEKKNAEIKEKIDRGEKMGMRNHREKFIGREKGLKRKCSFDNNRNNIRRRFQTNKSLINVNKKADDNNKPNETNDQKRKNESNNNRKNIPAKKEKIVPQIDNSKTLKPFAGILNLIDDIDNDDIEDDLKVNDSIEDDEYSVMDEFVHKNVSENSEPVVCGALSSLMCSYESSDDETIDKSTKMQCSNSETLNIENGITEQVDAIPKKSPESNINIHNASDNSDNDSGPEETKIVKAPNVVNNIDITISQDEDKCKSKSPKKAVRTEREEKNRNNYTRNNQKKFKPKVPSTLLEKLLRNEIRQERNIVLQCIRYIIKNNYFEEK